MTDEAIDLAELERLERGATAAPWETDTRPSSGKFCEVMGQLWNVCVVTYDDERRPVSPRDPELDPLGHAVEDARLIVALRNAAPELLHRCRRLEKLEGFLREHGEAALDALEHESDAAAAAGEALAALMKEINGG